ncbi:MAG: hypothetical protein KME16_12655 [Scytolyngbya sp. HA4215-MV1]|jgi:hypothetical protein|nr:hypothetical protein [Scytolyngbya sp. HA4215-MV1]
MNHRSVQFDPLDSPHPIPWNWVMATLTDVHSASVPQLHCYRSQSLISPDGQYAAYSRIQVQVYPEEPLRSRVSSVLFLENLKTGSLQTLMPASPFSDNPFAGENQSELAGTIAVLIPIGWSKQSDRLLAREFESIFCSDIASDYAVIWDSALNRVSTFAPTQIHYTNAVILGWSQTYPNRVLFRTINMGEPDSALCAVDWSGQTVAAQDDQAIVFGQRVNSIWTGPQAKH